MPVCLYPTCTGTIPEGNTGRNTRTGVLEYSSTVQLSKIQQHRFPHPPSVDYGIALPGTRLVVPGSARVPYLFFHVFAWCM
jgi:hypothetical protein